MSRIDLASASLGGDSAVARKLPGVPRTIAAGVRARRPSVADGRADAGHRRPIRCERDPIIARADQPLEQSVARLARIAHLLDMRGMSEPAVSSARTIS